MRATASVGVTDEGHDEPARSGTRGATRTVQVGLAVFRGVVVQHARDPVDVDAARGDVGGDQRCDATDLERGERPVTLVLRPSAVDRRGSHAGLVELGGQTISAPACTTEHDGRSGGRDQLGRDTGPLGAVDPPEHVMGAATVGLGDADVVANCVVLILAGEDLDRAVERRREQHRLTARRCLVEQTSNLGQEPHVSHAIGFVDHDDLNVAEVEGILAQEVGQSTRTCDEHVDTPVELAALAVVADAAVDRTDAQPARRGERLEFAADLRGQFTRRCEDQRGRLTFARLVDADEERDTERDRLAGPGRRAPQTSRPASASGMVAVWISKGWTIPPWARASTRSAGTPRSPNGDRFAESY